MRFVCIPAAASLALALAAPSARALGPVDIEVAATGGYGTNPTSTAASPLGPGIGARVGASMLGFYAGAQVAGYFGSGTASVDGYKVTDSAVKVGGELGYGLRIATVTLRPRLGVGDLIVSTSPTRTEAPCQLCQIVVSVVRPSTQDDLYIDGGVTGLFALSRWFFAGADVDFLVIPNPIGGSCCDELETAFTVDAQLGARF